MIEIWEAWEMHKRPLLVVDMRGVEGPMGRKLLACVRQEAFDATVWLLTHERVEEQWVRVERPLIYRVYAPLTFAEVDEYRHSRHLSVEEARALIVPVRYPWDIERARIEAQVDQRCAK